LRPQILVHPELFLYILVVAHLIVDLNRCHLLDLLGGWGIIIFEV
jgi:hypothetical protein